MCWDPQDTCAEMSIPLVVREARQGQASQSPGTVSSAVSHLLHVPSVLSRYRLARECCLVRKVKENSTRTADTPGVFCSSREESNFYAFEITYLLVIVFFFCFLPVNCYILLSWVFHPFWWLFLVLFFFFPAKKLKQLSKIPIGFDERFLSTYAISGAQGSPR